MSPSEVARQYLGETEKPGNMGFTDVAFEKRMKEVGWQMGQAWCSYACELWFKEAFPERFEELDNLFSGSTVQTFKNFRDAAYPIGLVPAVNHLVIWQRFFNGKPQPTGHAGIVSEVKNTWEFKSIEGNTNDAGGREGYIVAEHERKVLAEVTNGLKILGFILISPQITLTI